MPKFDWCWCYMQRDDVCMSACFMDRFIHWIWEFIGLLYFYTIQIRMSDMCKNPYLLQNYVMMMINCKHHESLITFDIAPNGQIQKTKRTSSLKDNRSALSSPILS